MIRLGEFTSHEPSITGYEDWIPAASNKDKAPAMVHAVPLGEPELRAALQQRLAIGPP